MDVGAADGTSDVGNGVAALSAVLVLLLLVPSTMPTIRHTTTRTAAEPKRKYLERYHEVGATSTRSSSKSATLLGRTPICESVAEKDSIASIANSSEVEEASLIILMLCLTNGWWSMWKQALSWVCLVFYRFVRLLENTGTGRLVWPACTTTLVGFM